EIYADRPRELWDGHVDRLGTWPLDIDDLLASRGEPTVELPVGTHMGHVHLRVHDVPAAIDYYTGTVNLDLMVSLGDQAAFMSAGGYHHHIGANTWESRGAAQAPDGTARLLRFTIVVPDGDVPDGLQTDPSGNRFGYLNTG